MQQLELRWRIFSNIQEAPCLRPPAALHLCFSALKPPKRPRRAAAARSGLGGPPPQQGACEQLQGAAAELLQAVCSGKAAMVVGEAPLLLLPSPPLLPVAERSCCDYHIDNNNGKKFKH